MWTSEALIGFAADLDWMMGFFKVYSGAQVLFSSFSLCFLSFLFFSPKSFSRCNFGGIYFLIHWVVLVFQG